MATTGNLQDYDVLELLRLLEKSKKTGLLTVSRAGGDFSGWFIDGKIAGLQLGPVKGDLALSLLFNESVGKFRFEDNLSLPATETGNLPEKVDVVAFRALQHLPPQSLPVSGSLILTQFEDLQELELNPSERQLLQEFQASNAIEVMQQDDTARSLFWRLYRLNFLKERKVRVARLTVTLNREKSRVAFVDEVVLSRWDDVSGEPTREIVVRDEIGRMSNCPVEGRPNLGTQLLLSAPLLLKFGLNAGQSVLAQPFVRGTPT